MNDLQKILKCFYDLRDKQSDIEKAVEQVSNDTGINQEEVLGVLTGAGLYILPGSEEEGEIKRFISSADRTKTTVKELVKGVAWCFCISNKEAERLVHKWFNTEDIQ